MSQICYLCSSAILDKPSGDHAVPAGLIERIQPKAKGYDYAGLVPTHIECNNRFGPETYTAKALDLLAAWGDPECFLERQHVADASIKIMAINSECLPTFTEGDLRFFRIIDVREVGDDDWSSPEFFKDKKRTNPQREALLVALSVLAKSSAALLVKRHRVQVPSSWRIFSFPYSGASETLDFDGILGDTKPFEDGVKAWIKRLDTDDWFVIYKARGVLLFTVFAFSNADVLSLIGPKFSDTDRFYFEGATLNELLTTGWKKV